MSAMQAPSDGEVISNRLCDGPDDTNCEEPPDDDDGGGGSGGGGTSTPAFSSVSSDAAVLNYGSSSGAVKMYASGTTYVDQSVDEVEVRVTAYASNQYCFTLSNTRTNASSVSVGADDTCYLSGTTFYPVGTSTGYHYFKDGSYEQSTSS